MNLKSTVAEVLAKKITSCMKAELAEWPPVSSGYFYDPKRPTVFREDEQISRDDVH